MKKPYEKKIWEIKREDYQFYFGKYGNLIGRLEDFSAARQCHGGISAEAADALKELCLYALELEDIAGILDP